MRNICVVGIILLVAACLALSNVNWGDTGMIKLNDVESISMTQKTNYVYEVNWKAFEHSGANGSFEYCFPSGKYNILFENPASGSAEYLDIGKSGTTSKAFTRDGIFLVLDYCSPSNKLFAEGWQKDNDFCRSIYPTDLYEPVNNDEIIEKCCGTGQVENDYLTCPATEDTPDQEETEESETSEDEPDNPYLPPDEGDSVSPGEETASQGDQGIYSIYLAIAIILIFVAVAVIIVVR